MLLSDSEGDSIKDDNSDPDGGIFDDVMITYYILHVVLSIVIM